MEIWPDKFIKRETLTAGELARRFNILNPRSHPEAQRDATEASLDKVGWFDEVSLSTNGDGPPSLADNPAAVMFDGHERVELALVRGGEAGLVPVKWYQLTPDETDFALLVKDQTTEMAETKAPELAALLERTKAMTVDPRLGGLLAELKARAADGMLSQWDGNGNDPYVEWKGMPEFEQEDNFGAIATVKVHFATEDDIKNFAHLVEQTVTDKSTFIWYPKRADENLKPYRVIDES